jgi:hypothetical protein
MMSSAGNARSGSACPIHANMRIQIGIYTGSPAVKQCMFISFTRSKVVAYRILSSPSNRVATATRKLQIVNDPLAKSFGPTHVDCSLCNEKITLMGEGMYNLTDWEAHKESCPRLVNCFVEMRASQLTVLWYSKPIQPQQAHGASKEPIAFSVRPPPSSSSTDGTFIASDSNIPPGSKRLRDDSDVPVDDSDVRPSNRPRTETYEPTQKEAPSAMGWFMLPLKAFVRGFRESLKSS